MLALAFDEAFYCICPCHGLQVYVHAFVIKTGHHTGKGREQQLQASNKAELDACRAHSHEQ